MASRLPNFYSDAQNARAKILIAEDDENIAYQFKIMLEHAGYDATIARDGVELLERMSDDVSVVLLDNLMPRLTGMECLPQLKRKFPNVEVIMLSVCGPVEAVIAMNNGAFWYLQKPINNEELLAMIGRAVTLVRLREQSLQYYDAITHPALLTNGEESYLIPQEIFSHIDALVRQDASILITGETGTGKCTLARVIHERSTRKDGPFVTVNCGLLPRDLLDAELFGYERGAIPHAVGSRPGQLELADGGTLLLDEVGDLTLDLQGKLLRFLVNRTAGRIGAKEAKPLSVRVIAATLYDLPQLCLERRFLSELYAQFQKVRVHLPPLRERKNDLPRLAEMLLRKLASRHGYPAFHLESSALALLRAHRWPGNVRELERCLERALLASPTGKITRASLNLASNARHTSKDSLQIGGMPLAQIEKVAINQTIDLCGGNKREAARRLGISEKTIYNKMQRFER